MAIGAISIGHATAQSHAFPHAMLPSIPSLLLLLMMTCSSMIFAYFSFFSRGITGGEGKNMEWVVLFLSFLPPSLITKSMSTHPGPLPLKTRPGPAAKVSFLFKAFPPCPLHLLILEWRIEWGWRFGERGEWGLHVRGEMGEFIAQATCSCSEIIFHPPTLFIWYYNSWHWTMPASHTLSHFSWAIYYSFRRGSQSLVIFIVIAPRAKPSHHTRHTAWLYVSYWTVYHHA